MSQGRLRYTTRAGSSFDPFTQSGDPAVQKFIRDRFDYIGTFAPFFNPMLSWMPNALVYVDAYAVYVDSSVFPNSTANPDLIATDVNGNKLFINWRDGNGNLTQYAGDITSPLFINFMIELIKGRLYQPGGINYAGLWLDDVNLLPRTCDASGNEVLPVDPATKAPMTPSAMANYFARYLQLLRNALPASCKILENSVWYTPSSPGVDRQIATADYINKEFGFNSDGGITGGSGQFSLASLFQFIDRVHSHGSAVVIDELDASNLEYSVAAYFLINNGHDLIGFQNQLPDASWPSLLAADIGFAYGSRSVNTVGAWSRQFSGGIVHLMEPGAPSYTFKFPRKMVDFNGVEYSSLTLGPKKGKTLMFVV